MTSAYSSPRAYNDHDEDAPGEHSRRAAPRVDALRCDQFLPLQTEPHASAVTVPACATAPFQTLLTPYTPKTQLPGTRLLYVREPSEPETLLLHTPRSLLCSLGRLLIASGAAGRARDERDPLPKLRALVVSTPRLCLTLALLGA